MEDEIDRFLLCMHDPIKRRWVVYHSARDKAEVREKKIPGIKTRTWDIHEGEFID